MDLPQLDMQQRGRCLADLFESHLRGTYPNYPSASVTYSPEPNGPPYRYVVDYGPNLSQGFVFTGLDANALGNDEGKWVEAFDRRWASFLKAQAITHK
jgi:hypothetical protein